MHKIGYEEKLREKQLEIEGLRGNEEKLREKIMRLEDDIAKNK